MAVARHFTYKPPKPLAKCQTAVCKLCGGYNAAKSIERERKHLLDKCPKYEAWELANNEKLQTKIRDYLMSPIDLERKDKLDDLFAFAMFKTGRPFTAFEDDSWIQFFKELGYQPPSASTISTKLLDKAFTKMETVVSL